MTELIATREFTPSVWRSMEILSRDAHSQSKKSFSRFALIVVLGFAAWCVIDGLASDGTRALGGIATGLVVVAVGGAFLFWVVPRAVQKYSRHRCAFTRRRYTFSPDSLLLETADGVTLRAPYRTFVKISPSNDYLVFWDSFPGFAAHIIPCEEFESKDHERIVKHWLAPFVA